MMRRAFALALALLLSACATPPRPTTPSAQFWSGRIGLQVLSDPPQSFHAGFELQGSPEQGELTLLSPVGGVLARLQWDAHQATLERGSDRWRQASVDLLTRQLTPAPVPIAALFAWLKGQAAADDNWTANLSGYADGRIQAQRLQPLPRAELRLVLDR